MTAYVIGHIAIKNATRWAEYRQSVPETLAPFGGELVLRGRNAKVLAGEHAHTDVVVLRFPSLEAAQQWHASAAYQALIPLRQQAADVTLTQYEADPG